MIKFYGIFQLVKVHKEDKTKKGDTTVYFTAAAQRGEDQTDFKFFKMFGNNADFFLRNLPKDDEGKYKSRKMMIEGYIETYNHNQEVECLANIRKDKFPEQAGFLKNDIKIKAKKTIAIPKDTFKVTHFEFVDKKKEEDVEVLINDEMEFVYDNDDNEVQVSGSKSSTKSTTVTTSKAKSKDISKEFNNALMNMDGLQMIDDMA